MADNDMKTIWDETNTIISTQKMLKCYTQKQDQIDSLIPLLYERHGSLDVAVTKAAEILQASISTFESASQRLLNRYSDDLKARPDIQKFIHSCMCACTANLSWR
ncbi:MAG: hypothetical protein Q9190_000460 [Brigantiaea leucoxantha]